MKILYKYIIKKFLFTFLFITILFILIAIVFDISEKIDDFVRNKAPLSQIVFTYYLNFIPYFMNLLSPLFVFMSAVYFTSRMSSDTEIIAILTSGTNYYRLLIPYFSVALLITLFSIYLSGWVIPEGTKKKGAFEAKYVLSAYINPDNNIHRQISPDVFIYMQNYDFADSTGYRFSLEEFKGYKLKSKLEAQSIKWNNKAKEWVIYAYTERTIDSLSEKYISGKEKRLKLPISPQDFGRKTESVLAMNNNELREYIKKEKLRGDQLVTYYHIELYKRTAMPFATFVLVLIALPISSRKIRGGIGIHLALGFLIAFSYLLIQQFTTVFSLKANLNALLSVWLPNVVFAALGIILLLKTQK